MKLLLKAVQTTQFISTPILSKTMAPPSGTPPAGLSPPPPSMYTEEQTEYNEHEDIPGLTALKSNLAGVNDKTKG